MWPTGVTPLIGAFIMGVAFVLSASLVKVSIAIAHKRSFFDHPDGDRKQQLVPIPKLGGVALAIAFSLVSIGALMLRGRIDEVPTALMSLVPAIGAALLGYADDKRPMSPHARLALQFLIGVVIAVSVSGQAVITGNWAIDGLVAALWVVALINGVNLLDNSDGLAGSTVMVSSLVASVIALASGQTLIAAMGFGLAGSAAGFLVHNWAPAKVYMGDAGAYFLGALLAVLTLRLNVAFTATPWSLAIPVLIVALPLADTMFVVCSRTIRGLHPFTAGRDHLSHQLQARGLSVPHSVIALQGAALLSLTAALALCIKLL